MHDDTPLITAIEAMERLGQAYDLSKQYIDNLVDNIDIDPEVADHDEVNNLYNKYVGNYLDWLNGVQKDINVYQYDDGSYYTLYFTHNTITNHQDRTLKTSYIIKPTDSFTSQSKPPWNTYRLTIKKVESDKIVAPISLAYFFLGMNSITDIDGLANWNTSNVTTMSSMLSSCSNLTNVNALTNWDISSSKSIGSMFQDCTSLNNIDGLNNWNISNVESTAYMFSTCSSLTSVEALSAWDTSAITRMDSMFYKCSEITSFTPLNSWNVSNVTSHITMFDKTTGTRPSWGIDW